MPEPLQAQQIMLATLSGALVVMFGALYALLFAFGRIHRHRVLMAGANLAYLLFAGATLTLTHALELTGFWLWVVAAMLIGYLLAPRAIWHLCVGTHAGAHEPEPET